MLSKNANNKKCATKLILFNVCRTNLSIKETKIVLNFLIWAVQY